MDASTRQLADYAAALDFARLPAPAVHEAKRRFIDSIGCAIGAFDAEPARIARAVAARYSGTPSARILGTLQATCPEQAAFANGVMLRYADYNDSYFMRSSGHPSDTLAAVLAAGEAVRASGRDTIVAAALAYEVFCGLSDVLPREQGWDYVVHGVLAAAVAAGRLYGLDRDGMAQAIALAVTPNMALEQTRVGELSMWKGCAAANASRNGMFAALLAQQGLTGPTDAIEGRWGLRHAVGEFRWLPFGGEGGPFRIACTHIKYYPAVVHSQSPIAAAIELGRTVDPAAIETIAVDTYWVARRYVDRASPLWHPGTRETADHSLPYIVAVALLDGTITEASFAPERLADPRIADLMARMTLREDPEFTAAHPQRWPCRIRVSTRSGGENMAAVDYFKGHAQNPMTDAEVEHKFRALASPRLGPKRTEEVLGRLWRLDEIADVGELIGLIAF